MRKIIISTFVSLDGVMQAPGGPQEDTSGGFSFGGWLAPHADEQLGAVLDETFQKPFDLLLGRKTYDIFAAYWPYAPEGDPIGTAFDRATKYVATRNPDFKLNWQNSEVLGSDVTASLKELKQSDGPDLLIQGSGNLIQTLLANDLVDELTLVISPVLLGKGKRLFADGNVASDLKLVSSQITPSGIIIAKYVPNGEVKTGDFSNQQPSEAELERRKNLN